VPWPGGPPRAESDLMFARLQVEGMLESGIAGDPDEAATILLEVGEIDLHEHARLLSREAREEEYGAHGRSDG
jgi:hypothetical protein